MPRGNPNVWKRHGASYSELAGTTTAVERAHELAPRRLPPVGPGALADMRTTRPAGTPAMRVSRGAGSFVMQNGWSLGTLSAPAATAGRSTARSTGAGWGPSSAAAAAAAAAAGSAAPTSAMPPRTYTTEAKTSYVPPPADFRRASSAGPMASQMPKPNQPNDWSTSQQVDFRADRHVGAEPTLPVRQRDSGRLLPSDVPSDSQFTTQHRTQFRGRTLREAQSIPTSGCHATQASGYNIITGTVPYNNNAFEHWDARDYRRHR